MTQVNETQVEGRCRKLALDAQGPVETILGLLRLNGEVGSSATPRLEEAHDAIKRIVDGDNWRERYAALEAGKPVPEYEPAPESNPR